MRPRLPVAKTASLSCRRKRHQKKVHRENEVPRLETPSPTPENEGKDETPTAVHVPLENTDETQDVSSDVAVKETGKESNSEVDHKDSETDSSSDTADDDSPEVTPRPDSRTETELESETVDLIPNGQAKSHANESSIPLIPTPKPSHSKIPRRRTLSKSSDNNLPSPVHTEVRLSSADFNVAIVAYSRSTSQDYTKIDVQDHDEDEGHPALYGDISTSWATSFWTQFSVLMVRTFKQSKPDVLSKLNFVQVGAEKRH